MRPQPYLPSHPKNQREELRLATALVVTPVVIIDEATYCNQVNQYLSHLNALNCARLENMVLRSGYENVISNLQNQIFYDVNKRQEDGKYLLHHACIKKNLSEIELLIRNGADPLVIDSNFMTPLNSFASMKNISNDSPNLSFQNYVYAIELLTQNMSEHQKICDYLNFKIGTAQGFSSLHFAVFHDNHLLTEALLSKGADVNLKDNYGRDASYLFQHFTPPKSKDAMGKILKKYSKENPKNNQNLYKKLDSTSGAEQVTKKSFESPNFTNFSTQTELEITNAEVKTEDEYAKKDEEIQTELSNEYLQNLQKSQENQSLEIANLSQENKGKDSEINRLIEGNRIKDLELEKIKKNLAKLTNENDIKNKSHEEHISKIESENAQLKSNLQSKSDLLSNGEKNAKTLEEKIKELEENIILQNAEYENLEIKNKNDLAALHNQTLENVELLEQIENLQKSSSKNESSEALKSLFIDFVSLFHLKLVQKILDIAPDKKMLYKAKTNDGMGFMLLDYFL